MKVVHKEQPALNRESDVIETAETLAMLREAGEFALLVASEPLAHLTLGWHPPSKASVSSTDHAQTTLPRPTANGLYDFKEIYLVGGCQ